jgi:hypothetical protein
MSMVSIDTPVALIIFNRPETTSRVMAEIAKAKPQHLMVIADGPRVSVPGEADRCARARAIVEDRIDWPCTVSRNYSDVNLGCQQRVSSGLDWVFALFPEAIILEDDCLPSPSFFPYCHELLKLYRNDPRVMCISGSNLSGYSPEQASYYFSRNPHIWGWASWSRAWRLYDRSLEHWPAFKSQRLLRNMAKGNRRFERYWMQNLDKVAEGEIDTWDFQWTFSCWLHGGLAILPAVNLVENIGFDKCATHTKVLPRVLSGRFVRGDLRFPLVHAKQVERAIPADTQTEALYFKPTLRSDLTALARRLPVPLIVKRWLSRE